MTNTTIKENWDRCLKAGEEVEQHLITLLKTIDPDTKKKQEGYYKYSDIEIPRLKKLIEVKRDYKSGDTGNFAVEIRCKGELSGLSVTKADYYVMVTKAFYYFFKTNELKAWIKKHTKDLRIVIGGDDMNSQMILIEKRQLIFQYFTYALLKDGANIRALEYYLK